MAKTRSSVFSEWADSWGSEMTCDLGLTAAGWGMYHVYFSFQEHLWTPHLHHHYYHDCQDASPADGQKRCPWWYDQQEMLCNDLPPPVPSTDLAFPFPAPPPPPPPTASELLSFPYTYIHHIYWGGRYPTPLITSQSTRAEGQGWIGRHLFQPHLCVVGKLFFF